MAKPRWAVSAPAPTPCAHDVDVWRVGLDSLRWAEKASIDVLSPDERDRAARFRSEVDRLRFVRSHVALRTILAGATGTAPGDIVFGVGPSGKPFIREAATARRLEFNLTHSGDLGLVALSWDRGVGIDVEQIQPVKEFNDIVARHFSAFERAALEKIAPSERLGAFFTLWVAKEAYLKGTGDGISRPLDAFDVAIGDDGTLQLLEVRDRPSDTARWTLTRLDVDDRYAAALAVEGSNWQARFWHWAGT